MTTHPTVEATGVLPLLGGRPGDVALVTAGDAVTYAELSARVDARRTELGPTRRLVLLEAGNDVESVVTYLAALTGGHPVLLAAPGDVDRHAELVAHYRPDVVQHGASGLEERRPGSAHDLHPDLAVLLSTSGSTGSPKLVRLSRANVVANARSIAAYLGIRDDDRAITSLPLHYCYGLSVLNSHLVAGAGIVLTELSVADECFWTLAAESRATSLAGVPYTFELLDASGFRDRACPTCGTSPRPAAGWIPRASVRTPRSAASAAGTCSSCTARPRRRPGWRTCRPTSRMTGRRPSASRSPAGASGWPASTTSRCTSASSSTAGRT